MLIAAGNIHTQSVGRKDFKAPVLNGRTPPLRRESNADLAGSTCSLGREVMTCATCELFSLTSIYGSGHVASCHWPVWFSLCRNRSVKTPEHQGACFVLFFLNVKPAGKTTQEERNCLGFYTAQKEEP